MGSPAQPRRKNQTVRHDAANRKSLTGYVLNAFGTQNEPRRGVMSSPSWASVLFAAMLLGLAGCEDDAGNGRDGDSGSQDGGGDAAAMDADVPDEDASEHVDADDGLQEVSIRFKAKLGAEDLACGTEYPDQGSTHITATPQDFRFYVQEVRLVRPDGSEEQVEFDDKPPFQSKDVALIDFTDGEGDCGSGGSIVNTTITGKVAAGAYAGIVFVNGVPEELNHAGPAETADPPLDDVTMFWGWLSGYRFIVAELLPVGSADGDGGTDGGHGDSGPQQTDAAAADGGLTDGGAHGGGHGASEAAFVHIGSTGCEGDQRAGFSCTRQARNEIRLEDFDPESSFVVADLAEVFKAIDLSQPPQCHGVSAPCVAPYAACGIDMETGEPSADQQVFRVE
jgi:uncharacterized repeat protein (TIGR04052 family)